MEFLPHYPRHYRRSFERKLDHERRFYNDQISNSYQQDSSHLNMDSLDLSLKSSKNVNDSVQFNMKIKQESLPALRRYFCIFCKMDFVVAEEFLDHLESLHPQGSFVLVKRDPPPQVESPEPEEPSTHLPILPDIMNNQIKIEPISEDDDSVEDDCVEDVQSNKQAFSEGNEECNNNHVSEEQQATDPNHQLMILSNPSLNDGPGSYLCNVCNAKFVYKNNLKSHLKRHLGIYPYVCFCGKRYQFKCKLNKHIEQAHAKIKNFMCPVPDCPKKYFTRNDLAFHISVTHRERQEIPCEICNKIFNSPKSLQIHCRKYHRNQES